MPQAIQVDHPCVPARYFVALLKGIYLKGVGLEVLAAEAALLTVFGVDDGPAGNPGSSRRSSCREETAMLERLRNMLIKEFIQVLRDPRMRGVIFVMPLVPGPGLRLRRHDRRAQRSRGGRGSRQQRGQPRTGRPVLRFGLLPVVVTDPERDTSADPSPRQGIGGGDPAHRPGLRGGPAGGRTAKLQVIVDGTDSNTAGIVLGYAGADRRRIFRGGAPDPVLAPPRRGAARREAWSCVPGRGSTKTWRAATSTCPG